MDKIDMNILQTLDWDARSSIKKIAKQSRVSRDVVTYRIKKLEEQGIISGYYTIIDWYALGYKLYRLYIKFQNADKNLEEQILKYLINANQTLTVFSIDGSIGNIAMGVFGRTNSEFRAFVLNLQKKYGEFIHNLHPSIITDFYQYPKKYINSNISQISDDKVIQTSEKPPNELSQTDIAVINYISQNARKPVLEIASELQIPANTISYTLRKLEKKNIIQGYRAKIDHEKIGYTYYKFDITLNNASSIKKLSEFCKSHPYVTYEEQTIAGSDFEVDIEVPSDEAFHEFIRDVKALEPGLIRTWTYFRARTIHKWAYIPTLQLKEISHK